MTNKEYTPIRQFYAHIGFATIVVSLLYTLVGLFAPLTTLYSKEAPTPRQEAPAKPQKAIQAQVSAYTSTPEETDDTPLITASNQTVRPGIVANNCLPFGTKVEIAGKQYEVQDRMNRRYGCQHFDIWIESKTEALKWGRQNYQVLVLER